jgi:hypothetical protein
MVARLSATTDIGSVLYTDGWMLSLGSTPINYFDGTVGDCRWTGTPHASTSIDGQPWEPGGFSSRLFTVQRSVDGGVTWTSVRAISDASVTQSIQRSADSDYEVQRGVTALYRIYVQATDASSNTAISAYSPLQIVTTVNPGTWALKDPLVPANNYIGVSVQNASVSVTQEEQTGIFRVYGRSKALVTAGALTGADGSLEIFATSAQWATLEPLLTAQRTLLLQDPSGDQKYIRITSRSWQNEWLGAAQAYRVNVGYVEVEAP